MSKVLRPRRPGAASDSKYERVMEQLRQGMRDGRYPVGSRMPPEIELHKHLRVGRQTLLRALNDLTREGLIARRQGSGTYVTDRQHPPLLIGRHLRLGLLWPRSVLPKRLYEHFMGRMTLGALRRWGLTAEAGRFPSSSGHEPTRGSWNCPERGVSVTVLGEALADSTRHPALEAVREGKFDGLLTLGIIDPGWLARLLELGLPTVIADFPEERFSSKADLVFVDSLPGYRGVVQHLIAKGLRRIHFAGSQISAPLPETGLSAQELAEYRKTHRRLEPDSQMRQLAWRLAMEEQGITVQENWVHQINPNEDALRQVAERLAGYPAAERPEALVCFSVSQADYFWRIFAERGLPLEVAAAADSRYAGPALPVRIDGEALGEAAAAILLGRLQQPDRPLLRVGVPAVFDATQPVPETHPAMS